MKCLCCGEETEKGMVLCNVYCYSSHIHTLVVEKGITESEAKSEIFQLQMKAMNESKEV